MGKSSSVTVGYKYFLGVHFVPCLGPVDKVLRIDVADREAWIGNGQAGQITIDAPKLFGGDGREGGISGAVDIAMGGPTQAPNDYLQAQKGAAIPAFRGVLGVILRRCYLGNNPYLKPWAFKVQRVFVGDDGAAQWNSTKAGISRGITFRNAALYLSFDRSASMAGARAAAQRDAIVGFLQSIRDNFDPNEPNDISLVGFGGAVADTITRLNATESDYNDLIAWMGSNYAGDISGTNYEAAMSLAPDFFATTGEKDRVIVFTTDGEPNAGSLSAAAATVASTGADCYGFSIELADTTAIEALDNTPEDGVPVVVGGDPSSLINAFARAFSLGFDMNPAHILREVLIAKDTGGDGDASVIGSSFATAADTLFDEGFGLSFFWDNPTDKKSFIETIEQHVDAKLYQDRRTGLWELKLIRDDYDVEALPLFDRSNVIEWSGIAWPDPSTLPNQITVKYTDPNKDEPSALTLTNPARVQLIGRIVNEPREYPGIYSAALASRVASRDLRAASLPLCTGTIRARFVDPSINLGSPIKLHNPSLGISNMVARVVEITDGDGRDNSVEIRFVEDQFAFGDELMTATDSVTIDVTSKPQAATIRMVEEAPYFDIVRRLSQSETDDRLAAEPDLGFVLMTAAQPTPDSLQAISAIDAGAGYVDGERVDFSPTVTLLSGMTARADQTKAVVSYDTDLDTIAIGSLVKIGSEYLRIDSVTTPATLASGDYWEPATAPSVPTSLIEFGRGCLDTSPEPHTAGDAVICWSDFADADPTQFLATETINVKLRTVTGRGELAVGLAPADAVTFASRAVRPYPPGKVQIAGSYAAPPLWTGTLALTWAHRDRTLQTTAVFDDHTAGNIGPEAGTTYRVRVWPLNISGTPYGSPLLDVGAISGTSYSLDTSATVAPAGAWGMRVEVRSERGGYVSTRNRGIDVPVTVTPAMLPAAATWLDVNAFASLFRDDLGALPVEYDQDDIGLIQNQRGTVL